MRIKTATIAILSTIFLTACSMTTAIPENVDQMAAPKAGDTIATIETNKGTIKFKVFDKAVPEISKNFIELSKKGYYDGIIFHRVMQDFMIQTGDPTGTGRGGESYKGGKIADEFHKDLKHFNGTVSMANAGPNTNGSQFFIVSRADGTPHLDGIHSVFGQVIEGQEVVDAIAGVETGAYDKPDEEIRMEKVTIGTFEG